MKNFYKIMSILLLLGVEKLKGSRNEGIDHRLYGCVFVDGYSSCQCHSHVQIVCRHRCDGFVDCFPAAEDEQLCPTFPPDTKIPPEITIAISVSVVLAVLLLLMAMAWIKFSRICKRPFTFTCEQRKPQTGAVHVLQEKDANVYHSEARNESGPDYKAQSHSSTSLVPFVSKQDTATQKESPRSSNLEHISHQNSELNETQNETQEDSLDDISTSAVDDTSGWTYVSFEMDSNKSLNHQHT